MVCQRSFGRSGRCEMLWGLGLGPPGAQLRHLHRLESLDLAAFPFFGSACLGGLLLPSLSDATPGTAQGGAGRGRRDGLNVKKGGRTCMWPPWLVGAVVKQV
jgi:hypothetical protein